MWEINVFCIIRNKYCKIMMLLDLLKNLIYIIFVFKIKFFINIIKILENGLIMKNSMVYKKYMVEIWNFG